jgi:hypothetical protein
MGATGMPKYSADMIGMKYSTQFSLQTEITASWLYPDLRKLSAKEQVLEKSSL